MVLAIRVKGRVQTLRLCVSHSLTPLDFCVSHSSSLSAAERAKDEETAHKVLQERLAMLPCIASGSLSGEASTDTVLHEGTSNTPSPPLSNANTETRPHQGTPDAPPSLFSEALSEGTHADFGSASSASVGHSPEPSASHHPAKPIKARPHPMAAEFKKARFTSTRDLRSEGEMGRYHLRARESVRPGKRLETTTGKLVVAYLKDIYSRR